jgi:hypothetical protein
MSLVRVKLPPHPSPPLWTAHPRTWTRTRHSPHRHRSGGHHWRQLPAAPWPASILAVPAYWLPGTSPGLEYPWTAADGCREPPSDVHKLSKIKGIFCETTIACCLLWDVINVARLGDPRPAWSPPPLHSTSAGPLGATPLPHWVLGARAHVPPSHLSPSPVHPAPPSPAGNMLLPSLLHLPRPIPFWPIPLTSARTPLLALPPPPPTPTLGDSNPDLRKPGLDVDEADLNVDGPQRRTRLNFLQGLRTVNPASQPTGRLCRP